MSKNNIGDIYVEDGNVKLSLGDGDWAMLLRDPRWNSWEYEPVDEKLVNNIITDKKVNWTYYSKEEETKNKENKNMFEFGNIFNGMFKPVAKGFCKMGINGQVAIKTNSGYKTFDIKKNKLMNCDNFAFDMDGMFWVIPVFKVEKGDIIMVNGKPNCVIEVGDKSIKTFSYENSTINETIPEHYVFMGKTYCYGKIFSPFMNMGKDNSAMSSVMSMMMMSQMFGGNNTNMNNGFNPMMFMFMNNGGENPFMNMFEGAFNFGDADEKEDKEG